MLLLLSLWLLLLFPHCCECAVCFVCPISFSDTRLKYFEAGKSKSTRKMMVMMIIMIIMSDDNDE